MTKPTLADLNALKAVAHYRSFRKAADELGVSRSSLSHAIAALERNLGVRLLHRTTRSVAPTEAGERFLQRLTPALEGLDQAIDAVVEDGGHPTGTLRINGGEEAIRQLLKRVVPTFLQRYPHILLDLVIDGRLADIVKEGFDAGIRLEEAVPQDMIAVALSEDFRFLAVAAPSYLAAAGQPLVPEDLQHHQCIRQRLPSGKLYRWEFEKRGQQVAVDVPGAMTLNHTMLMIDAAAAGLGIAYVPETAAQQWLEEGRLTAVLEDWSPPVGGLRLYYSSHRHVSAALRAFIEVMKSIPR
ncbi:LysR family transcriptional regulator [Pseudomonas seleniipraecipitans]|uniref:LysR family transcriptional regulator n=1 Tax=Phytopseudomonas seleniipraecipitans TaxID=640205 RepID=A0ABY5J648_9GAMM|nr:LysR family transcriptional regulator [Pseudomonas seleniipraecipitans]UUD63544.1 LysR family transcriptional regulator [Pseudomonas seleniipraecipitans]